MKRSTRNYWKILILFIIVISSYVICISLWDYIDGTRIDMKRHLFVAVIIGIVISWTTISNWKRYLKSGAEKNLTEEDLDVYQSTVLTKDISIDRIYILLKRNKITATWKFEMRNSKIIGRRGASWIFMGDRITVSKSGSEIEIESRPILRTTIMDNGSNRDSVLLIRDIIEKG